MTRKAEGRPWRGGLFLDSTIKETTHHGSKNDEDGADVEEPDEEGGEDGNPACGPPDARRLRQTEHRGGNKGHDGRTNTHEETLDEGVAAEMAEEHGKKDDEEDGHDNVARNGREGTPETPQTVAKPRGHVDGQHTGHGLRESQLVKKLLATHPAAAVHQFLLHEGYHGVATTNGESAYFEKRVKKFTIFYHHPRYRVSKKI